LTPAISSVSPAKVDTGGGESITITGSNFEGGTPNASVSLGNNQCQDVNVLSATQIRCNTPAVTTEEKVAVIVTNGGKSAGKASAPCAGCLEFADIKGPKVTEFFPLENSEVSILVSAKVKFNEAVKPTTVSQTSFFISGTNVVGTTFCDFACQTACGGASNVKAICFKPSQPLAYSSNYTGTVRDSITDLKDNKLQGAGSDGTLKWNFKTRCINCGNPWLGDIAAASGFTSSTNYRLYSVTGQPTPVGEATSDNYHLKSGFIYSSQTQ
jgi:hypothetical protein